MAEIRPELPAGVRDYGPSDMIPRQKIIDNIKNTFESFGFDPLDTPMIERLDVLTGNKENFNMSLFRTAIVKGLNAKSVIGSDKNELALRFDLTVPLARYVASNLKDLPKPFKRYQVGKVARGEKPQSGRFREFIQFDIDIVGAATIVADAEIVQIIYATLINLGLENFLIKINNRKILNGLATLAKVDESDELKKEVFRIMDKLEKIGLEQVKKELSRQPENEFDFAPALSEDAVSIVEQFILFNGTNQETIDFLRAMFKDVDIGMEGIEELSKMAEFIKIPEGYYKFDLAIARGLDYYTGPIFETVLLDLPEIGSIFSGGRYDGLVSRFSEANMPATGASVGIDRLFAALSRMNKVDDKKTISKVLIAMFDDRLTDYYLDLALQLRSDGINTQIYLGIDSALKAQISYALGLGIPILIIAGNEEERQGGVQVKILSEKKQFFCKLNEVSSFIKKYI